VNVATDELLIAVATFSSPRIFKKESVSFKSYELIRFASLLNSSVIGGLDKLLNALMEEKQPGDIMTYADLDWSDGRSYSKLGFETKGHKEPEPIFLHLGTMERSSKVDVNEPEHEADPLLAPDRLTIYNMGSLKFVRETSI
jgi:hypothetical protein